MVEWDLPEICLNRMLTGVYFREIYLSSFFWPECERLFDWTALTTIFHCTTDATSFPVGKPGLDCLEGDFLDHDFEPHDEIFFFGWIS